MRFLSALLPLLLLCPLSAGTVTSRTVPVVPWDSSSHQQLQLSPAVSRVQCGGRCLRAASCVALAFSSGQCRLLTCASGHTVSAAGLCEPDCPPGTELQAGQCHLQCPSGWSLFNNACYLRVAEKRLWAASEAHCGGLQEGAHLASVHSSQEETFIWDLMTNSSPSNYHIGLEHLASEPAQQFHWVDDTAVSYTNWRSGQPNFDQAQHLGTSVYLSGEAWCDVDMSTTYNFQSVCKFTAGTP